MKFKVGDKVRIKGLLEHRVGTIKLIADTFNKPYCIDFGMLRGEKYVTWSSEELLQLSKTNPMKFRMEVDQADLYQGRVTIPWYMGRSYSDMCMSIYYYHIIPFNFLVR